jgi:hypothetical protein
MIAALGTLSLLTRIGIAAGFVAVIVGSCALRDASLRKEGAAKAVAKIEKANKNAVKKADEVGRKSRDPASRGVRDPYYTAN